MASKIAAAALQYSKWLSRFICWVWATHRFIIYILSALVPEAAGALVSSIGTLDTIMIINEGTYLINSLGEKYIYSDRFVLSAFKRGWFSMIGQKIEALKTKLQKNEEAVEDILTNDEDSNG